MLVHTLRWLCTKLEAGRRRRLDLDDNAVTPAGFEMLATVLQRGDIKMPVLEKLDLVDPGPV